MSSIIRLLLTMISQQLGQKMHEPQESYTANGKRPDFDTLLDSIPFSE